MKGVFNLPIIISGSENNLTPEPYIRPVDWLEIDSLVNVGDQKLVALVAIFEEGNFIAVSCVGNYTINWGDGQITNHTQSTVAYHQYDWNYVGFNGTLTSDGYKQAILTITPQVGQNLTTISFNQNHNQAGLTTNAINGLLDVKLSGSLISTLTFNIKNKILEQVDFVGTNSITNAPTMFGSCFNLRKIKNLYTNNVTNFNGIFSGCYKLEHLPNLITSSGSNFNSMFYQNYLLKSIPTTITFNDATTMDNTFFGCFSIVKFPTINAPVCTVFTNTFRSCYSMLVNPEMITSPTLTKSFTNMFTDCYSLREFKNYPNFNTNQGSSYTAMFSNCYSLEIVPDTINTSGTVTVSGHSSMFNNCYNLKTAPNMDLSKSQNVTLLFNGCISLVNVPVYTIGVAAGTNLNSIFNGCVNLVEIPDWIFTQNITVTASAFQNCNSLQKAPNWNLSSTTNVNSMFNNCSVLVKIPNYNLSTVNTSTATMFANCYSLINGTTTGLRYTVSYSNCKLSRQEIVNIFNGLGTAVGTQTITITGNYGASSLTVGERAIATGKGWTIVG